MIRVDRSGLSFEARISEKPLCRDRWSSQVDHEKIADQLSTRNLEFASVLVICEPLRDSARFDPKYVRIENSIAPSKLQQDATGILQGKYPTMDEIRRIIKRFKLPTRRNNYDIDDRSFYDDLEKKVYEVWDHMMYPGLIWNRKTKFESEYLSKNSSANQEEIRAACKDDLIRYLMPQVTGSFRRIYSMPHPLSHWDPKNLWQQFYLIRYGDEIRYGIGAHGTAGFRLQHGRWSNVFVALEKKHHFCIPLYCCKYDQDNCFRHIRTYESFKSLDLSSGYPIRVPEKKTISLDLRNFEPKDKL